MKRRPGGGAAVSAGPAAKRCAIYTRKSTAIGLEDEFNSLVAQREACQQYIRSQPGWHEVETYEDGGFTGANIERPAFQRLLLDIEAKRIDVLVVYKVDRLSRSLLDFAKLMDQFNEHGVTFVSVTQNFSTADAMGRLTLNMLMSFAEFEREMIGERIRDKLHAARRRGRWTGGKVPLGYDVVDKKLVVNDLEALVVREVFSLYVQHRSQLAVMRELESRGRRTKQTAGRDGVRHDASPWSKAMVMRILRNPVYAGFIPCGAELFNGEHTPLIERQLFEEVQRLMDENTEAIGREGREHGREEREAYLLRGLLQCGCGAAMTPTSTRRGLYRYYRCVKKEKRGTSECSSRPLPAEGVEAVVVERVRAVAAEPDLVRDVTEKLTKRVIVARRDLEVELKGLPNQISKLSGELEQLLDRVGKLTGAAHVVGERQLALRSAELNQLQAQHTEALRRRGRLSDAELESRWVARSLADFESLWAVMTIDNRHRLLSYLFEKVVVHTATGQIDMHVANRADRLIQQASAP